MRWFRFYDEALDDPKVQRLPPPLFKLWVNLLCVASQSEPRGTLPDLNALAFRLRLRRPRAQELIDQLLKAGLIDRDREGRLSPHNWSGRQRRSDDVAERVRRHRGNESGNEPVTLPKRSVDTDTELETDAPPISPPRSVTGQPSPSSYETQLNGKMPEFIDRFKSLDSVLDEGWFRFTLRRIEKEIGVLPDECIRRALGLAHRQIDLRLTAARKGEAKAMHSPRKFAETVIVESLKEQRDGRPAA